MKVMKVKMDFVDFQGVVAKIVYYSVMIPLIIMALVLVIITVPIWIFPWAFSHVEWMNDRIPNKNYRKEMEK